MSLYPADILSDPDFIALDLESRGAVWTLLLYQWQSASDALPDAPEAICRLIGLTPDRWPPVETAVDLWFPPDGDRRSNAGLSQQRNQAAAKVKQNRENAKKRWQ